MIIIGGLTRLTGSGLSITEWQPIMGVLPPLNEAGWAVAFEKYKQIPQYSEVNVWFSVAEFKEIFWLEYIHRLLGRVVGVLFLLPFIYFTAQKYFTKKQVVRFIGIFALGGLQGFIGWFMVSSGLFDRLEVSHFRLGLHLVVAFFIYALLLWSALDLVEHKHTKPSTSALVTYSKGITYFIFIVVFLGALVAGSKSGFMMNTFPLMDGQFVPEGIYFFQPWWLNHMENPITIQFQHRVAAILLFIDIIIFSILLSKKLPSLRKLAIWLAAVAILQVVLGAATIISFGGLDDYFNSNGYKKIFFAPVILAVAHQLNALILLNFNLVITHRLLSLKAKKGKKSGR